MSEKSDSEQLSDGDSAAADSNTIWNDVVTPMSKTEEPGKALEDVGSGKEDMFEDFPDDILVDEVERLRGQLDSTIAEKESSAVKFEEERESFVRELGSLRVQLRGFSDESPPLGGDDISNEPEKTAVVVKGAAWSEMINECSGIVKKALERHGEVEVKVRELEGVMYGKDQEIEGLNANVKVLSEGHCEKDVYFEGRANRMLGLVSSVVGQQELVCCDREDGKEVAIKRLSSCSEQRGYMAPEYAMEGLYSVKSDVYGYGVLLLESITGRRNTGFHLLKRAP